jgi:hypothetical protein
LVPAIAAGHEPIPRVPGVVVSSPAPPKPVTVRLFAMKPVTWRDAEGLQRFVGKFNDVDLPETAAAFALEKGFCVELTDPRRKQLHGTSPGHPDHHWCVSLDNETETTESALAESPPEEQHTTVLLHSSADPRFEPVDRGGPIFLKTAAGRV